MQPSGLFVPTRVNRSAPCRPLHAKTICKHAPWALSIKGATSAPAGYARLDERAHPADNRLCRAKAAGGPWPGASNPPGAGGGDLCPEELRSILWLFSWQAGNNLVNYSWLPPFPFALFPRRSLRYVEPTCRVVAYLYRELGLPLALSMGTKSGGAVTVTGLPQRGFIVQLLLPGQVEHDQRT